MSGVNPADCPLAYGPNDDHRCWWDGRPLRPTQAVWCSTGCEAAFREAHEWRLARTEAYRRAAGRCTVCKTRRNVQVHHEHPAESYEPSCAHHPDNLAVLCSKHHAERHRRLRAKPGTQLDLFRAA